MTTRTSAPGRWRRIGRTMALELRIGGVWTAGICKAAPDAYVWTLFGNGVSGTALSEYAAQRAVRRALRAAKDGLHDPSRHRP